MKYYIDKKTGEVFAYHIDGSQDKYIKQGLTALFREVKDDGSLYSHYLAEPDEDGIYQPDTDAITAEAKSTCKLAMKTCSCDHCCDGALVTVTVDEVDYTGVFYADDEVLENAAGVALYRETVDASADAVSTGNYWYTEDADGNDIAIPITETLLQKITIAVKNWQVSCSLAYKERSNLMLAMDDVSDFDHEADMEEYLPSREITIS